MEDEFLDKFVYSGTTGAVIKVIGVGGGGGNAVNYMCQQGIEGVLFVVCNTDEQDLRKSPVRHKIQLGKKLTKGLGAGSQAERGRAAAEESISEIKEMLKDTEMVFITAGLGGGTGTGASPVVAQIAKEMGILTVAVVTIPFEEYEPDRYPIAVEGMNELKKHVDSLLIIKNEKIEELYGELDVDEADAKANELLCTAVRGIAEIITYTGTHNVDFADVKTAMQNSGIALMGMGRASGENRAIAAVEEAINSPLLDSDIHGAKHLLVNIVKGTEKKLLIKEEGAIKRYILSKTGNKVQVKYGRGNKSELGEDVSVTIIATGFEAKKDTQQPIVEEFIVEDNDPFKDDNRDYFPDERIVEVGAYGVQRKRKPILIDDTMPDEYKERPSVNRFQKKQQPNGKEGNSLFALNGNNEFVESTPVFLRGVPD